MDNLQALLDGRPPLEKGDYDVANARFAHYAFFRRDKDGVQYTTSCCGTTNKVHYLQRTTTAPERMVLQASHNDFGVCPHCGRALTWKEAGRGRKKLRESRRAAFLRVSDPQTVWIDFFWLTKDYTKDDAPRLGCWPTLKICLRPGEPVVWEHNGDGKHYHPIDWLHSSCKPFAEGMSNSLSFDIIGAERLAGTFLEHCQHNTMCRHDRRWEYAYSADAVKYLCLSCVYPTEMLAKMGLRFLIDDLYRGVKNVKLVDWSQSDPRRAFGLTAPELRAFCEKPDRCALRILRHERKHTKITYDEAVRLADELAHDGKTVESFLSAVRQTRTTWRRVMHYLERQGVPNDPDLPWHGAADVLELYDDYLDFACRLRYDMTDEMIAFPRDLQAAHDRAAVAFDAVLDAGDRKSSRIAAVNKRYAFETDRYLIRAPYSAKEIVREGKRLKHCVGGYALDHEKGRTTILFLRDKTWPHTPLVTIEMNGNRLVQAHGYCNENAKCPENPDCIRPRTLYAEIFDQWLAWVEAGSRRDKDGKPVIPKNKEKECKTA